MKFPDRILTATALGLALAFANGQDEVVLSQSGGPQTCETGDYNTTSKMLNISDEQIQNFLAMKNDYYSDVPLTEMIRREAKFGDLIGTVIFLDQTDLSQEVKALWLSRAFTNLSRNRSTELIYQGDNKPRDWEDYWRGQARWIICDNLRADALVSSAIENPQS